MKKNNYPAKKDKKRNFSSREENETGKRIKVKSKTKEFKQTKDWKFFLEDEEE